MRTVERRLNRLEATIGQPDPPRVVIVSVDGDRCPLFANFRGAELHPDSGESLEAFEHRAEQHFSADKVVSIVAGREVDTECGS
jgi:hypothetical protein